MEGKTKGKTTKVQPIGTFVRKRPSFSGKIISPIWLKNVIEFQSMKKEEQEAFCKICGCTGGCNMCEDISRLLRNYKH